MKYCFPLIFLLLISLVNCSEDSQKPKELIAEDTYIDLLVELQLVRSYGESNYADSLTVDSLANKVFGRYGVSDTAFYQSHQYYQQFPEEQEVRIDEAIERLKMDQVENGEDTTSEDQ